MAWANLVELLRERETLQGEATYLNYQDQTHTYAAIAERSRRFQKFMETRGLGEGDYVVLMLDNGPNFFAAFFGALLLGGIPVPISPKSTTQRLEYILDDCGAKLIFADDHFFTSRFFSDTVTPKIQAVLVGCAAAESSEPSSTQNPTHPIAFIQYTSGSTGSSKGALISHAAVLANIEAFSRTTGFKSGDVLSSMMPLFHDMGLIYFGLGALYNQLPLILFRQEAISLYHWLDSFGKYHVTHSGGPNIFLHLANKVVRDASKYNLSELRMFVCGSEPIFPSVVHAFEQKFGVRDVIKPAYGMAEISLCATITPVEENYRIIEGRISCGRPLHNVDILILDDHGQLTRTPFVTGEVLIKTPSVMDGYLNRPEQTQEAFLDGYYKSGDEGFFDETGTIYIVGRRKNLIIRGGEKFAPSDLEALAMEWPEVQMSGVVGLTDSSGGPEESIALVLEVAQKLLDDPVQKDAFGRSLCTQAQTRCRYMPDLLIFTLKGNIPVTHNGKMQHQILRKALEAGTFPILERIETRTLLSK